MTTHNLENDLLESIPGGGEPVRSTCDGLPGDGGESTISGQSRELEGDRPTENLLYPGFGPQFREEPSHPWRFVGLWSAGLWR